MTLNRNAHYFFCGIGGSGMLPLALIMKGNGYAVEGSDRALDQGRLGAKFEHLRAQGIGLYPQDGSGIRSPQQILITSAAIENTIPDVQAAQKLNLPMMRRAELLAELFNAAPLSLAIGGTSGKSTTTGMAAWILHACHKQPTVMNGAVMNNFVTQDNHFASALTGSPDCFVSEVDESDGSIALYRPQVAVVTNISLDHKPLAELRSLFSGFVGHAKHAILNFDNEDTRQLALLNKSSQTFSLSNHAANFFASEITPAPQAISFNVTSGNQTAPCKLNMPGRHNVANALAAIAGCVTAGVPLQQACQALAGFKGISRRFDIIGTKRGITIIDDFAHNPDKIAATFHTLKEFPGRVIVMFQPHGFGPLKLMGRELADCFAEALSPEDILLMPDPAYYGGTTSREVGSNDIVNAVARAGKRALYIEKRSDCLPWITGQAKPGDRIVIMGARDDSLTEFAKQLFTAL